MKNKDGFSDKIKEILGKELKITLSYNDKRLDGILNELKSPKGRNKLAKAHDIIVSINSDNEEITIFNKGGKTSGDGTSLVSKEVVTRVSKTMHTYVPPKFHPDVVALLKSEKPNNLFFYGASGSGKTEMLNWISTSKNLVSFWKDKYKDTKSVKIYKIDGGSDIDNSCFFGSNTITIDPETKQNIVTFHYGTVVKAMQEGLDKDGNEIGSPGILFIDEFSSCPSEITIRLNGLLGTDNPVRSITLDNGEIIKSHSGFKVVCAGNTSGRGLSEEWQTHYTAQGDAIDGSTLNRFTATFRFGYDRNAEKSIINDKIINREDRRFLLEFKDAIRESSKEGNIRSIFSTRDIVKITDLYQLYENDINKAVYYSTLSPLPSDEKAIYNEKYVAITGVDLLRNFEFDDDFDFV